MIAMIKAALYKHCHDFQTDKNIVFKTTVWRFFTLTRRKIELLISVVWPKSRILSVDHEDSPPHPVGSFPERR